MIRAPRIATSATLLLLSVPGSHLEGQWVEPRGQGWLSATTYHHETDERYDFQGEAEPFFADGRAVSTSLYLTAAAGIGWNTDVWLQLPVHRLRFDDAAESRLRTGVGDPRVYLRVTPLSPWIPSLPLAIRGGVKLPLGDLPVDPDVIPLTEGQRDWELMVEIGHSFYPAPVWVMGWVGYRWREADEERRRDPGDERFAFAQLGGDVRSVGYRVQVEGWWGHTPVLEGLAVRSARRRMVQLAGLLSVSVGPGSLEGGVRAPLSGRNLPAGHSLVLGYFLEWGG